MRMLNICKSKRGNFLYRDVSMNGAWLDLPQTITDAAGIKEYFMTGRDQRMRGRYDEPRLMFTDQAGKPLNHYSPVKADDITLVTVNYDKSKRLAVTASDVWSEAERLQYLRDQAIHLPSDIDTTAAALDYLKQNEDFTTEIYKTELEARTAAAIERACNEHAAQYRRAAIIDG